MGWTRAVAQVSVSDVDPAERLSGERRSGSVASALPTRMPQAPSRRKWEVNR